jgi:DNA sulfur modification protein DndC
MGDVIGIINQPNQLSKAFLLELEREIREVYAGDSRPWVIGYSGGKDSTTALQLVWNALLGLPAEMRTKPVYVISSDTLVETPKMVEYVDGTLARMDEQGYTRSERLILGKRHWTRLSSTFNAV